jgi:hypothetical protein
MLSWRSRSFDNNFLSHDLSMSIRKEEFGIVTAKVPEVSNVAGRNCQFARIAKA